MIRIFRWNINQQNSPFLRLPGEIRNIICELALGGNTILVEFNRYKIRETGKAVEVITRYKYQSWALPGHINPFRCSSPSMGTVASTVPLLNGVCRQLYIETAILPYKLNWWAFQSHNIMVNFLWLEKKISRNQRAAIKVIVVPNILPQSNLLSLMGGLERVFLAAPMKDPDHSLRGWYKIVRTEKGPKLVMDCRRRGG
jgi:hypothetical protein